MSASLYVVAIVAIIVIITVAVLAGLSTNSVQVESVADQSTFIASACDTQPQPDVFTITQLNPDYGSLRIDWDWTIIQPANMANIELKRFSDSVLVETLRLEPHLRTHTFYNLGPAVAGFTLAPIFFDGCTATHTPIQTFTIVSCASACPSGQPVPEGGFLPTYDGVGGLGLDAVPLNAGRARTIYYIRESEDVNDINTEDYDRRLVSDIDLTCASIAPTGHDDSVVFQGVGDGKSWAMMSQVTDDCGRVSDLFRIFADIPAGNCATGAYNRGTASVTLVGANNIHIQWSGASAVFMYKVLVRRFEAPRLTTFDSSISSETMLDYTYTGLSSGTYYVTLAPVLTCGQTNIDGPSFEIIVP